MAHASTLLEAPTREPDTAAGSDWDMRVLALGAANCNAIKSKAACVANGLEISHAESLANAVIPDGAGPDALLVGFDGSAEAEQRLERLPPWLSAAVVAILGRDDEALVHQALKCGADEVISPNADVAAVSLAVRRALARKASREHRLPKEAARCEPNARMTLVQETAEGLVILDHDGAVRFANDVAENLLGAEPGSLTGKPFRFPVSAGEPITAEFPEGRSTELRFIETEWGGLPARIGSLADVTVRRELERAVDALEELQGRMEDRDRVFVSELSATIRRPLTNIVGFSELMLAQVFGPIGDERYSDYARDIRDSGLSVVSVLQALESGRLDTSVSRLVANPPV